MSDETYPSLQPEEWLLKKLENTAASVPRYEASWYGLYNALLSHYFPYQQRFLIKPQSKIRDEQEADISFSSIQAESSLMIDDSLPADENGFAADLAADTSMSSMGGLVIPGTGSIYIPDFVVVKGTTFTTQDTALLVIEVKVNEPKDEAGWDLSGHQISNYMKSLSRHSGINCLVGLLICGTKVRIFRLEDAASGAKRDGATRDIQSKAVRKLLLSIAKENWSYSD